MGSDGTRYRTNRKPYSHRKRLRNTTTIPCRKQYGKKKKYKQHKRTMNTERIPVLKRKHTAGRCSDSGRRGQQPMSSGQLGFHTCINAQERPRNQKMRERPTSRLTVRFSSRSREQCVEKGGSPLRESKTSPINICSVTNVALSYHKHTNSE